MCMFILSDLKTSQLPNNWSQAIIAFLYVCKAYTFNQMFPKYFFQVKFYWSFCVTSIRKISNQLPACFLGVWLPVVCYHFPILSNLIPWWFKCALHHFPFPTLICATYLLPISISPKSLRVSSRPQSSASPPTPSSRLQGVFSYILSLFSFYYDGSSESNHQLHYFSISINHA